MSAVSELSEKVQKLQKLLHEQIDYCICYTQVMNLLGFACLVTIYQVMHIVFSLYT